MKTKIYMVRHGFSLANSQGVFAGQLDVPLNEQGKEQAAMTGEFFRGKQVDALYVSDLMRTVQTAAPIEAALGLTAVKDPGLREISAGEWEGIPFDELEVQYPEDYRVWRQDVGRARCTGGESTLELSERIITHVRELAEKHSGQTLCLVTHATPIRALCVLTAGLPPEEMAKIPWVSNASVSEFEYEDGVFTCVCKDQNGHLGNLVTKLPANV